MAELIRLYEKNPNAREIDKIVNWLRDGAVIIFPTDSIYAMGCDMNNNKALAKVAQLKGVKLENAKFSLICNDLSHISHFIEQIDTPTYKLLKRTLPGPFTFIMNANKDVRKRFKKKKTIGIRVPDNNIIKAIALALGNPLMSTSIKDDDELVEYTTDPELIYEKYKNIVDIVIDGGVGNNVASTVIDLCGEEPVVVRAGKGDLSLL